MNDRVVGGRLRCDAFDQTSALKSEIKHDEPIYQHRSRFSSSASCTLRIRQAAAIPPSCPAMMGWERAFSKQVPGRRGAAEGEEGPSER